MTRKVRLGTGEITIALDYKWFTRVADISKENMNHDALTLIRPFHLRRRRVETEVILWAIPVERDETLIANIRKAQSLYVKVIAGQRFGDVSGDEGFERSCLKHMIGLAFLAPDIVERVANGNGPIGLTSEWVKRNAIPQDWAEQRAVFDAL